MTSEVDGSGVRAGPSGSIEKIFLVMSDTQFPLNPIRLPALNRIFPSLLYQTLRFGESGEDHIMLRSGDWVNNMAINRDRARIAARIFDADMREWLSGGEAREDGRLAIFDQFGEPIDKKVIKTAIASGFAEPWFASPMRPQWTVCRLTQKGHDFLGRPAKTK